MKNLQTDFKSRATPVSELLEAKERKDSTTLLSGT